MSYARFLSSPLVLAATILAGCGGGERAGSASAPTDAPGAGTNRGARTLSIPGAGGTPDNPRAAAGSSTGLVWDLPEGWVNEPPASSMRLAQYRVPGSAGDGECVVFYFGPGQGGDPASNAARWARQFRQPDGRDPLEVMEQIRLDGTSVPVQIVEVTGIYDGGMTMTAAPAEEQPGYMLLGAIAQGPDAPWFFKFTGPEATVRAQRDAFVELMESIRIE